MVTSRKRLRIAERLAKQPLGSIGVAQRSQQEIDGGTLGIDGPVQIAPATLHTDVGFVHSPRLVCRLEMLSQSLLQLRAVILHPAPDRGVIDIEATLLQQQLLNIAQRQRIAKIPPDRTKYEAGFGLPPFEDRGSGSHFAILSRHRPAALKVATHPAVLILAAIARKLRLVSVAKSPVLPVSNLTLRPKDPIHMRVGARY